MNKIGELLKVADMLDEQGDFESADELVEIIKDMADEQLTEPTEEQVVDVEERKAWVNQVVTTLVKVADSLEDRGAVKEAQMADELLVDLKQDLPQAFNFNQQTQVLGPDIQQPEPVQEDIIETTPFQDLPNTPAGPHEEVEPADINPSTPDIKQLKVFKAKNSKNRKCSDKMQFRSYLKKKRYRLNEHRCNELCIISLKSGMTY